MSMDTVIDEIEALLQGEAVTPETETTLNRYVIKSDTGGGAGNSYC